MLGCDSCLLMWLKVLVLLMFLVSVCCGVMLVIRVVIGEGSRLLVGCMKKLIGVLILLRLVLVWIVVNCEMWVCRGFWLKVFRL